MMLAGWQQDDIVYALSAVILSLLLIKNRNVCTSFIIYTIHRRNGIGISCIICLPMYLRGTATTAASRTPKTVEALGSTKHVIFA